ncbi:MAG: phosphoribosylanthranilate isomerase [Syntrophomonadaceae bacterium]|nr:phosphoribosylanthranilate isomerase [Syntrophomonadaceae bacterium]
MTKVKICGITNIIEAQIAINAGTWAIGEVFAHSKGQITPEAAARINYAVKYSPILKVGVFVNEDINELKYIAKNCLLDMVQLHGHEPPEYVEELDLPVIKAISVSSPTDIEKAYQYEAWAYLFDTKIDGLFGGTGLTFNWEWLTKFLSQRVILAGGLNPQNVKEAIRIVRPMAVDVSSGVEFRYGGKDPQKIMDFINSVKEADQLVS